MALMQLAIFRFFKYKDVKCVRLLRKALVLSNSFALALGAWANYKDSQSI